MGHSWVRLHETNLTPAYIFDITVNNIFVIPIRIFDTPIYIFDIVVNIFDIHLKGETDLMPKTCSYELIFAIFYTHKRKSLRRNFNLNFNKKSFTCSDITKLAGALST